MKSIHSYFILALMTMLINQPLVAQSYRIHDNNLVPAIENSAILDIYSNNKGLLIPRMTTAIRSAIGTPAIGLVVYDSTQKDFFHYNGWNWSSSTVIPNTSILPYSQQLNTNNSVLQIENSGAGNNLEIANLGTGTGISSMVASGFGMYINTITNIAMNAGSNSNNAIYAIQQNQNNSLPAMRGNNTGGGTAFHASSINKEAIDASTVKDAKAGVRGEGNGTGGIGVVGISNLASGIGVGGGSLTGTAVFGQSTSWYGVQGTTSTSSSSYAGVYGYNSGTQGSGVLGISNFATGYGVQGSTTTGTGVFGYSNSFRGVAGSTIGGTALYGYSNNGYGLELTGKVKISGGNTNPGENKVLTSDALGNASWQPAPHIAFRASGISDHYIPNLTYRKINFSGTDYNIGTGFSTTSDVFTVPVSGLYHFDFSGYFIGDQIYATEYVTIYLKLIRAGVNSTLAGVPGDRRPGFSNGLGGKYDVANLQLSGDFSLLSGDQIWMEIIHNTGIEAEISKFNTDTFFSGHLIHPL